MWEQIFVSTQQEMLVQPPTGVFLILLAEYVTTSCIFTTFFPNKNCHESSFFLVDLSVYTLQN